MWYPSSPARNWTHTPYIGRQSLTHWTRREVPKLLLTLSYSHFGNDTSSVQGDSLIETLNRGGPVTIWGSFLVVQWLRLDAFTAMDPRLIPGQGTKIPQAVWHDQKIKQCWPLLVPTFRPFTLIPFDCFNSEFLSPWKRALYQKLLCHLYHSLTQENSHHPWAAVPNLSGTRDGFCGRQIFCEGMRGIVSTWFKHITFIVHFISNITSAPPQVIRRQIPEVWGLLP